MFSLENQIRANQPVPAIIWIFYIATFFMLLVEPFSWVALGLFVLTGFIIVRKLISRNHHNIPLYKNIVGSPLF